MRTFRRILFMVAFAISFSAAAQTDLDSLWSIWQDESVADTTRLAAIMDFVWDGYLFTQPDSAFYFAKQKYELAESRGLKKHMSDALNIQGVSFYLRGNYSQALTYYQQCLEIREELNDKKEIAGTLNNIGLIYENQGDYLKALEFNQRSLAIREELGNEQGVGSSLNNLGNIYRGMGNYPKALELFSSSLAIKEKAGNEQELANSLNNIGMIYQLQGDFAEGLVYYQRSLRIREKLGIDHEIASSLNNIGIIHRYQGNNSEALAYYQRSLMMRKELGDKSGIAATLNNIGSVHKDQADHFQALAYYEESLSIHEELGGTERVANCLSNIGSIYEVQGKYMRAVENCRRSYVLAKGIGALDEQINACECLYKAYRSSRNHGKALEYFEILNTLQDSLNETETAKKLQRYEFDKELLADSLTQEEEKHTIELAHQEEVAEKDKTRNMLMGGGLLLLLVAGGLFSRNRYVNRSKKQIQKEKDRSEELLLNILPEEVAEELKDKGEAEAQLIDQVTVLFTDFKGFTAMSEQLSPKELVDDLNLCFSEFDRITAKYGIEKIKTIGDAYMAAGGLPTPNTTHATDVIKAAFEMRDFVEAGKARKIEAGLPYFEIRIGVHTGPVVAGIVGVKKFQYDIWGDTVNTASRMESSGEVGQVNISEATYKLVKGNSEFGFTSRGKIAAKGKGEMEMYFVERT